MPWPSVAVGRPFLLFLSIGAEQGEGNGGVEEGEAVGAEAPALDPCPLA